MTDDYLNVATLLCEIRLRHAEPGQRLRRVGSFSFVEVIDFCFFLYVDVA